jgi:hypothetical protein
VLQSVSKLVALFECGLVTRHEAVNKLMQLASETPPAEIASELPAEWLVALRRDCEEDLPCPPAGGMLFFHMVTNQPGDDANEAERLRRECEDRWRAGFSAWLAFFGIAANE